MSIPLPKVYWPRVVSAADNVIPVRYSGVTYNATIAAGTYLSAELLRSAVATALTTAIGALGWTVSLDLVFPGSLSFFGNAAFEFWFASAPSNIAAAHLGFNTGLDVSSSGNRIDSPFQIPNAWYSTVAVADDSRETKDRDSDRVTIAMSGQSKRIQEVELTRRRLAFQFEPKEKIFTAQEAATVTKNAAAERWWSEGAGKFRYWPDRSVEGTSSDWVLAQESLGRWEPRRMFLAPELYSFELNLRKYVS